MKFTFAFRLAFLGLGTLILISVITAFSAGIVVTSTNLGVQSSVPTANEFKPYLCEGLSLSNTIQGIGTIVGTSGNDLILGSPENDIIDGNGGDDCILSGGGNDNLDGGDGTDICIGGPGEDGFTACEGQYQ